MSTINHSCDSLYNLSLNQLKYVSMDENILQFVLKFNIPPMLMDIIWKMLCVNNENQEFVNDDTLKDYNQNSINRGHKLTQLTMTSTELFCLVDKTENTDEYIESFANTQQTEFNGNFQGIDRFTLGLFFKLMKATQQRDQLFTIFQICIQYKGLEFPQQLAEEWLNTIQNVTDVNNIEQGQELGIFLCDAGWYKESAQVLSYTYKILCTKLECIDQNLKMVKIVQCLTKLLLALSNYYNIKESKLVLKYLIKNVNILKNREEGKLCVAYAYFAISKYHELLMEFNKAWLWAMKAVNKLHNNNDDKLKLILIGHAINISGKDKKSIIQYNFVAELHAYNKTIEQHIFNELLTNQVRQLLEKKQGYSVTNDFYCSLDMTRNLYGYYNLNTANQFLKYAEYCFYQSNLVTIIIEAINCVLQALYIMDKLLLPKDNMLVVRAQLLKSILLQKYIDIFLPICISRRNKILNEVGVLQMNALKISIRVMGKNTQYTSNVYYFLGSYYRIQEQYEQSECMFLEAMQIRNSILGNDTPLVAQCLITLGDLYAHDLDDYEEAERYYLAALNIYEESSEEYYPEVLNNLARLVFLIHFMIDIDKYIGFIIKQLTFERRYNDWKIQTHTEFDENRTNSCINLEKFKHILSNHFM